MPDLVNCRSGHFGDQGIEWAPMILQESSESSSSETRTETRREMSWNHGQTGAEGSERAL
jgi:hypothetical protein